MYQINLFKGEVKFTEVVLSKVSLWLFLVMDHNVDSFCWLPLSGVAENFSELVS